MKKWISNTINGVLGTLIVLVVGVEVAMFTTRRNNYDVPSLFGYSFMRVLTDSMEGDRPDSLSVGTGVVVQKTDAKDIRTDDIVTFYSSEMSIVVSHRVRELVLAPSEATGYYSVNISSLEQYNLTSAAENDPNWVDATTESLSLSPNSTMYVRLKDDGEGNVGESKSLTVSSFSSDQAGLYTFYTTGDNGNSTSCNQHQCSQTYRDTVKEAYLIGRVTGHSDFFGGFLGVIQSTWFIPVAVLCPLAIIAAMSLVDYFKESKKEKAEEEALLKEAMAKAGINPNDEKAVILFEEKFRYKNEIAQTMAKEKEKEKKKLQKELEKKNRKDGNI